MPPEPETTDVDRKTRVDSPGEHIIARGASPVKTWICASKSMSCRSLRQLLLGCGWLGKKYRRTTGSCACKARILEGFPVRRPDFAALTECVPQQGGLFRQNRCG